MLRSKRGLVLVLLASDSLTVGGLMAGAVAFYERSVPLTAEFGCALAGAEVDKDQAEPLAVALAPFVVVHQRPGEVAPQVDTGAGRSGDVAVEISDSFAVIDVTVRVDVVVIAGTVFGHVEGQVGVLLGDAVKNAREGFWRDGPVERCGGRLYGCFAGMAEVAGVIVPDPVVVVVVDRGEVGPRPDEGQVACVDELLKAEGVVDGVDFR